MRLFCVRYYQDRRRVELGVRSAGSNSAAPLKLNYQLLLSSDGYIYGRLSEYRQGQIHIGDKSYVIRLRSRNRNNPLFSLTGDTVCLIDLNRDGDFSERWHISGGGDISPREEIELSSPFILDGERLRIVALDPAGASLRIQASLEEVSISAGFKAPEFTLTGD